MPYQVYGCFLTEAEAVNAVSNLELKGYKAKNITILTNLRNPEKLEQKTDVNVESSVAEEPEKQSFMDKVKRVFIQDGDEEGMNIYDKLTSRGIPEEEVEKCIADAEAGYTIVIIDNKLKMGHTPTPEPTEEVR